MLSLPPSVRIYLSATPTDMRRSFDGLAQEVMDFLGEDPLSGHLFVFRSRRGNRVKILLWDRSGYVLYHKRLEKGVFRFPRTEGLAVEIEAAELEVLKTLVKDLVGKLKEQDGLIAKLKHELSIFRRYSFGRKSERVDPNQAIFSFLAEALSEEEAAESSEPCAAEEPAQPESRNGKHGRGKLPDDLPRDTEEHKVEPDKVSPEKRLEVRQARSKPICERMKDWIDREILAVLPASPIGQAMKYAKNHWAALTRFLDSGIVAIDNNAAERALRPVVLGRKNYLFAGSDRGAKRAAVIYSLIASAKRHGVNRFVYLRDVLERLPTHPRESIRDLFPASWKPP